ncbi:MAG: response regulator [Flavobacteriales bacterium]|nr:response regulator [Flavobacteriales bacterium]
MPRVILVEDDTLVRTLLMRRMTQAGWSVVALKDGRDIQAIINAQQIDLLVVDLGLPYMDGLALLESIRARGVTIPALVISGYELPHLQDTVRSAGAHDMLQKPFDQEELLVRMRRLLAA